MAIVPNLPAVQYCTNRHIITKDFVGGSNISMLIGANTIADMQTAMAAPLSQARGLPNAAYVDPEVFAIERESLIGRTWAAAAHGSDLPTPGSVRPIDFMGLPLLLTRDRDGRLHVFHNVCSHRGMKLVREHGRVKGVIRCPYHSWSYNFQGALISTPLIGGAGRNSCEGFDKRRHGLKPVRFSLWMDILFINLSGDAPPFEQFIAPLEQRWERYVPRAGLREFQAGKTDSRIELEVACNWKLAVENYCEAYHLPWVHPGLDSYSPLDEHFNIMHGPGMAGQGTRRYDLAGTAGIKMPFAAAWPEQRIKHAEYIALFPNTLLGLQADHFFSVVICPQTAQRSLEQVQISFVGEAAQDDRHARCRKTVRDSWKEVFCEDIFAVEGMQAGRQSPGFDGGVLTPVQDAPTHHFHRWVANAYADAETP